MNGDARLFFFTEQCAENVLVFCPLFDLICRFFIRNLHITPISPIWTSKLYIIILFHVHFFYVFCYTHRSSILDAV